MTNKYRHTGRGYCNTSGSAHYKTETTEPLDLIIALGLQDGFCLGSIIKYASRFKNTRNLDDLKKVSDYAHILCGVELARNAERTETHAERTERTENAARDAARARKQTYCDGRECHKCPIGRAANNEHISCPQYVRLYPEEALQIMGEDE